MSNFMQCPSCKENIEDDSCYCDQCGEQILICSSCGRPGKGKRCIFDGKELVPAGDTPPPQTEHVQTEDNKPADPPPPQTAPVISSNDKVKLVSASHGITIEASNGDVLGRSKGPFAAILGRFSTISGSHCKLIKTSSGWTIEDMGSTNGTFYNGARLTPNVQLPLHNNTKVTLANVDLLITFGNDGGGTVRI